MRVDADITFKVEDSKDQERAPLTGAVVHINGASPSSVLNVVVNAFHNGIWTGKSAGSGTFHPARRLCSASAVYRTHCEHDTCSAPYGKEHETHSAAMLDTEHTHVLPKPKPEPEPKKEAAKSNKPKGRFRR